MGLAAMEQDSNLQPLGAGAASMLAAFHKPLVLEHTGEENNLQRLVKVKLLIGAVLALPASPHCPALLQNSSS